MAATCCSTMHSALKINVQRLICLRHYARNMRRSIRGTISPTEDAEDTKAFTDPRLNPFNSYVPGDPVQAGIVEKLENRKNKSTTKMKNSTMLRKSGTSYAENTIHTDSFTRRKGRINDSEIVHKHVDRDRKNENVKVTSGVEYEILNNDDKRFGRLILQAKSRKGRSDQGTVVLEGKNLILDAIQAGVKLKNLYFTNKDVLDHLPIIEMNNVNLYKVQYRHLQVLSDVETSQGILGLFEMPDLTVQPCAPSNIPATLICDNIRDGGNLGTLIRTAAAVGCQRVIILKGCVDIWNTKVLRSAMGAHFRVPIFSSIAWPQIPSILTRHNMLRVFLADVKQPTDEHISKLSGSEQALLKIESLSLETLDQGRQPTGSSGELHDNGYDSDFDMSDFDIDEDYCKQSVLEAFREAPLNVQLYNKAVYGEKGSPDGHTVLVISGETSGLSAEARKLAYDNYGECVCIPMVAGVESLNCAVAGSVILYEMHRQLMSVMKRD